MEVVGLLGLFIGIVAVVFQIKEYQNKNKRPTFKGRIGKDIYDGKQSGKFFDFIYKNEGKIIFLDINFDNEYEYKTDETGVFQFHYYYDRNKKMDGGFQFDIQVNDNEDFFYDSRTSSRRLKGYFKIIGFTGPQMGWIIAIMKPVNIENI